MTDFFDSVLPFYLAIGMTIEQYWDGEPYLCVAYRNAYDLKREAKNRELWLQGFYNYQAFSSVMAMFSYGLSGKKGSKPDGYLKRPVPITEHEKAEDLKERIENTMRFVAKGQTKK